MRPLTGKGFADTPGELGNLSHPSMGFLHVLGLP